MSEKKAIPLDHLRTICPHCGGDLGADKACKTPDAHSEQPAKKPHDEAVRDLVTPKTVVDRMDDEEG